MYDKNINYRFILDGKIYYTGKVIVEDSVQIKIKTIYGEEVIVSKKNIVSSIKVKQK